MQPVRGESHVMNLSIRLHYRFEFLPIVCAFVGETARAFGASDQEQMALRLAAEETAMSIIESFPGDDENAVFEISCQTHPDGLEYRYSNLGRPVNLESLPGYDARTPEESAESVDGLRLFLARNMVDELEFINLGSQGWQTRMFKRLAAPSTMRVAAAGNPPTWQKEPIGARMAAPADAPEIVQLAYLNYRYSFTKESFYFVEQLRAEMLGLHVVSAIACTSSGSVVGHVARIMDPDCDEMAEVGALMVRPEYRRTPALIPMLYQTITEYRDDHSARIRLAVSKLVTAHALSQRLAFNMGFKPVGLLLSTHSRSRFEAIQTTGGRESTIYAVLPVRRLEPLTLHVPKEHLALMGRLVEQGRLPFDLDDDTADLSAESITAWQRQHDAKSHHATLTAQHYGHDFFSSLRSQAYDLLRDRVDTTVLRLPAWQKVPHGLNQALAEQAFFFSGMMPLTPQRWCLLYTRLTNHHFSFDDVYTGDPLTNELKAYVRQCFEQLT